MQQAFFLYKRTIVWENDGVKDLMKRFTNDPVINDTGWLVNKKFKPETDLWSETIIDCIC